MKLRFISKVRLTIQNGDLHEWFKLPAAVTSPDQYSNHCQHKKIRLQRAGFIFLFFIFKTEYIVLF